MVRFVEPDVVHALEDSLEADARFGARQRTTGARVRAAAERDVLPRVQSVEAELGRALEAPRVAVGSTVEQHAGRTGADVDVADGGGPARKPEVGLDRALDAERFF